MKQKIKKLAHQLWTDESGQSTVEYALIIIAVVAIIGIFGTTMKSRITTFINGTLANTMDNMTVP